MEADGIQGKTPEYVTAVHGGEGYDAHERAA